MTGATALDETHRPRQIDGHDLVPQLEGEIVESANGIDLLKAASLTRMSETAETLGHVADQRLTARRR
jgi:hypothetical protein